MKKLLIFGSLLYVAAACQPRQSAHSNDTNASVKGSSDTIHYPKERHLANVRQISFGGDNAEAYFSFDSQMITFQSNNADWLLECDQIFYTRLDNANFKQQIPQLISTGLGRTTCSYFLPGDTTILYASTHAGNTACPPLPEPREDHKYVWPVYADFDIYVSNLKGQIIDTLVGGDGYDAEATVSPKGDKIVFTSLRSGDLELYTMDIDGGNITQITHELGYDGGAFFSPDGSKLVFRSSRPKTPEEQKEYKDLLAQGLVMPTNMEIYVCDVDGSNLHQVTKLGKANWAPFFTPAGDKIIFSSNHHSNRGYEFNLFTVDLDGNNLEQITFDPTFDAFPMFSFDGKKLIFSSNRNNGGTHDTNLFIADWIE